jgi:hypothetical protein
MIIFYQYDTFVLIFKKNIDSYQYYVKIRFI